MYRRFWLLYLGFFVLFVCSCTRSDGRKPTFPTTGKVLDASGKPLPNASVVFHPVGTNDPDVPKPRGKTDQTGAFTLTTYDEGDGAPVGRYHVTIELWVTPNPDQGPVNRVAAKYAKPESSGFTVEVIAGPNELKPFELKK